MGTMIKYNLGVKIGNCVFLKEIEPSVTLKSSTNSRSHTRRKALFKCNCGSEFEALIDLVKRGNTKSCGCLHKEALKSVQLKSVTHGQTSHPLYMTWKGMISRCYNKDDIGYFRYGGRGIRVCDEWQDINTFITDMYPSYAKGLQLDRINNDGDYNRSNCKWSTRRENSNNRRNNRVIEYNGISKTISEWSRELNIPLNTLLYRLNNWDVETSFTFKRYEQVAR